MPLKPTRAADFRQQHDSRDGRRHSRLLPGESRDPSGRGRGAGEADARGGLVSRGKGPPCSPPVCSLDATALRPSSAEKTCPAPAGETRGSHVIGVEVLLIQQPDRIF